MAPHTQPLVSVVTPFYNTDAYLESCILSVLEQNYENWEYLLVNNCSSDGSVEIAERYARKDARIRLLHNDSFLSQVCNYNQALSQISPPSVYCKIVQADDSIYPDCLSAMVDCAENDAAIGIVASHSLRGNVVSAASLPKTRQCFFGREICRSYFLNGTCVFGSPTTVMYRSEVVRKTAPFFDETRLHEDTDALFRTLADWKLGYVQEVLSFVRVGNESITSSVSDFDPYQLDRFLRSRLYTDRFFAPAAASQLKKSSEWAYLRFYASKLLRGAGSEFREYHRRGRATVDYQLPCLKLAVCMAQEIAAFLRCPRRVAHYLLGRLRKATPAAQGSPQKTT